MRITNEEKNFLFKHKVHALKEEPSVAEYEIERDQCYQENLKYDYRQLLKKLSQLEKENIRLNKIVNKNIVPDTKIESKNCNSRSCSVLYLNRILKYLTENGVVKSKIVDECMINNDIVTEGLMFLVKNKLIEMYKDNGNKKYRLWTSTK